MRIRILLLVLLLFGIAGVAAAQQDFVAGPLTVAAAACPVSPGMESQSTSALTLGTMNAGGATFTIGASAFSGTVSFFGSADGAVTWQPLNVFPSNSTTPVTTATAAGVWQVNVAAYTNVCMVFTTATSGTVTGTIRKATVSARAGGGGGGASPGAAGTVVGGTGGGTAQAQTLTPSPAITSLVAGGSVIYCWQPVASNSGPGTTLTISGFSGTIFKGPSGVLPLIANDIFLGAIACAVWDGTRFQLQNPQAGIGALTSTTNYGPAAQALNLYVSNGCTNGPPPSCTGNFFGFLAPAALAASLQYTGNLVDGSGNAAWVTDGAQHLSFVQLPQEVAGAGAVNVMTATFVPAFTAYAVGDEFDVVPNLANTTTNPTLNVNGLGAKTITKCGAGALLAGDYPIGTTPYIAKFVYDGTNMELQNPVTGCAGIPIGNVGSSGLSGTAPVTVSAAGAIGCATCGTNPTTGLLAGAYNCINVTPVTTAGGSVTTDQNMQACTIPAGTLNLVGKTIKIHSAGVYTTAAASSAAMTLEAKLCTISGCATGTVVDLCDITSSTLGALTISNDTWSLDCTSSTQTAGASSAYERSGMLAIDLVVSNVAPDTVFLDSNATAVTSPVIDSTAQLFLQISGAFSAASASNVFTGRSLVVESIQ